MLKESLIMISLKHSITATIEGNVVDVTYVCELEIHTVLGLVYTVLDNQIKSTQTFLQLVYFKFCLPWSHIIE